MHVFKSAVLAVIAINAVNALTGWYKGPGGRHLHGHHGPHRGPFGPHGGPFGPHGGPFGPHRGPFPHWHPGYHKYNEEDGGNNGAGGKPDGNAEGSIAKEPIECEPNYNPNKDDNNSNGKVTPPPTISPPIKKDIPDDPEEAFEDLAAEVIANDELYLKYCQKNTVKDVSESYGPDNYKLIISLGDNDPDSVGIKLKHRVIFIRYENPGINVRWSGDGENSFSYIRALPSFLDVARATWDLNHINLEVTIPYKVKMNSVVPKSCDTDINTAEKVVFRKGAAGGPNNENRFDNLTPNKDKDLDQEFLKSVFGNPDSDDDPTLATTTTT